MRKRVTYKGKTKIQKRLKAKRFMNLFLLMVSLVFILGPGGTVKHRCWETPRPMEWQTEARIVSEYGLLWIVEK